jgi:hypothetical protein
MQRSGRRFSSLVATVLGALRRIVSPRLYCFVSYRRNDVPVVAREVRIALQEGTFRKAFFDKRSLEAGASWPRTIRRELARSDVVFVIVGPAWDASRLRDQDDFVRAELVAAHRNRAIVTPLLVGLDRMPTMDDLPAELAYFPNQQWRTISADVTEENFAEQVVAIAGPPARRARRRKRLVRLGLVVVLLSGVALVSYARRAPETCGTRALDVGVAVRVDDRRSSPGEDATSEPNQVADQIAETVRDDLDGSPDLAVAGPEDCGPLGNYGDSDLPDEVAADANLDTLLTVDMLASDQESQLDLFLTFDTLAVPDAPEVSGTHRIGQIFGGRDISPPVVAERADEKLGEFVGVLNAFRLYAAGEYGVAAEALTELGSELQGDADVSLLRVIGLLRANSVLLQARSLAATDPIAAAALYDEALASYQVIAEVDGVPYGRAYLGVGEVWVERCRAELAASDDELAAIGDADALVENLEAGLAAFDTASEVAALDPETEVEVRLKSLVGRGNLALCATFLASGADRRVVLADQAEASFVAVVNGVVPIGRFENLAAQANVGLGAGALLRCDSNAPGTAIELAREHFEAALPSALPSRSADIEESIEVLDGALTDPVATAQLDGSISSSVGALLVAACGLEPG